MDAKPLTIGISGGSASGKTTFAAALAELLKDLRPAVVSQDRYFRDWSEYEPEERPKVRTSNHPRAVLWPGLVAQVERLLARTAVREPVPGSAASHRAGTERTIAPGDVILVEGHLVLGHARLRDLLEIKIYVEADPHERVLRRMLRDTNTGGMDLTQAVAWYRRDVIPNFSVHTAPTRRFADLIVPFDGENTRAARVMASGIRAMLRRRGVR
ncbi:MAG: uridine kinase [bacterium]|nr:uridine kinase [bacterium]